MYHSINFIGRVGKTPEMRFSPAGEPVTSFSVAVNSGYGDNKVTIWIRVSAWRKLGEVCNEHLKKGSLVMVEGRLQPDKATGNPRTYESNGKHGASYDVTASSVTFLDSKGDNGDDSEVAF